MEQRCNVQTGFTMYLSYYGLSEKPFDISTDPRFLWLGEKHKEAFAVLKYGVLENKGFLLLTGDIGAGKTTLINALVESFNDEVIYAFIPDPGLELMDFYRYLAHAFQFNNSFSNKADFIFVFREFLFNAYDSGKRVLLIIDEAQRLSNELLEEIRLLSNIELQSAKLLNIFFVGQAEFNTKLLQPENRSVRQRITISNHIQPLTEKETGDYIRHRLKVAGSQKNIFSYVAIHDVYNFSGGYPRLINIVCDIALLTGYAKDKNKISDDIIKESIESLNIECHAPSKKKEAPENHKPEIKVKRLQNPSPPRPVKKTRWGLFIFLFLLAALAVASTYMIHNRYGQKIRQAVDDLKLFQVVMNIYRGDGKSDLQGDSEASEDQKMVYPYVEETANAVSDEKSESKAPDGRKKAAGISKDNRIVLDFGRNSNDFSEENYNALAELASFLKSNPKAFVLVIGYTDDMGTYSHNISLSSFRANAVKSYLVGQGIDVSRIRATGLGPDNPRASNKTNEGREMNRRVEIEILNTSSK